MNTPRVGIGVLILNELNQLLLGQRLNSHGANSWGPVGGHLEFGETFEACAIREAKEEAGLIISSPEFIGASNDIFVNENKHYVSIFMRATISSQQKIQNLEPHKTVEWKWFDFSNLPVPENLFLPLNNFIMSRSTEPQWDDIFTVF